MAERETWLNTNCRDALRLGRKIYVGEGCWHCHSQFVRPVSNEDRRWGPVSKTEEYQNELQRPVMFGTRRVGPDLSREGGRHSNDWHAAHFFQPTLVSEGSPMPEYPWLFDGSPEKPTKRGLALMTYVQWLGSWLESYPYYEDYQPSPVASLDGRKEGGEVMNENRRRRVKTRRSQVITTIIFAAVILIPSGLGFANKFREFLMIYRGEVDGVFAITPIVNYLLASLGFFFLFCWAICHGMFSDIERPKYEMLENERRLDLEDGEDLAWY